MKILHFYDTENLRYGFFKDIDDSLKEQGHEVTTMNDRDFDIKELMFTANNYDLFLYHHGGIYTDDEINYAISLERLKQILAGIKIKKVCWFFDKGWFLNDRTLETIIPLTDYVFLNDGNWVRRHNYTNVYELHSGTGKKYKGKPKDKYKADVVFYGEVEGYRKPFIDLLKNEFGAKFKIFNNVFGQDLADLIASVKIIFVPVLPNEDFYWDNRIYQVLQQGGLLLYPRLYGLSEEGFVSGRHYLGYKRPQELKQLILDNLKNPNKDIAKAGQEFVKQFSYKDRLNEIWKIIK